MGTAGKPREIVIENRKAFHDHEVLEKFEAGLELRGTEVKSIRASGATLTGGYAMLSKNEFILRDVHIAPYEQGNRYNHEPARQRRLLMHRHEIRSIGDRATQKGLVVLPLRMYFKEGWVKVELGLCRARKRGDKREVLKKRTADRETSRAVRRGG